MQPLRGVQDPPVSPPPVYATDDCTVYNISFTNQYSLLDELVLVFTEFCNCVTAVESNFSFKDFVSGAAQYEGQQQTV